MNALVKFLTALILPLAICANPALAQPHGGSRETPPWIDEVQTYSMLPLLSETAAEMHISVNGIWAGISSDHPILPSAEMIPSVRKVYGGDADAYVKACHEAGLVVCGVIHGIEGMESLRKRYPKLEEMACRDAKGEPARNAEWLLLCTNNPDWINAEIELGKVSIDAGADVLHLDTPMGSAFLSGGFLKAGFCDHCMAKFERHLSANFTAKELEENLGVKRIEASSLIERLHWFQEINPAIQPFIYNTPDNLLFREFIRCQEQASFDTRKELLERLREHARERGRQVAFTTNAADLGTMNPFGHWVRGIMFADLVDFFAYEQDVLPRGFPAKDPMPLPRGKWAAYHKLAHAIHGRRAPAVIHAGQMGQFLIDVLILRRHTHSAWFGVMAAEAYASNGAYVMYHVEAPFGITAGLERFWGTTGELNGFVREHAELYDGDLKTGSSLALVMLLSERGRTIPAVFPSYLGFASALVEGSYPFDAVFGGDGHFVHDRLRSEDLSRYSTILVPSPISPTENQKQVIQHFVRTGGTVVTQEPALLGLNLELKEDERSCLAGSAPFGDGQVLQLAGEVTPTWTNDTGAEFFSTYDPALRTRIHELAESLHVSAVLDPENRGLVGAFPIVKHDPQRAIVHLVNYDVDLEQDTIRPKDGVRVTLPASVVGKAEQEAIKYAPGQDPERLEVQSLNGNASIVVPRLDYAASLVISPITEKN